MRLPKLANWLSEGDLKKYKQEAEQALAAQAKLAKAESELTRCQNNLQQTEKELEQAQAQLQINQGFRIELGETQLELRKVNSEAQKYKKELFEQQKQLNLLQSQLNQAKKSLSRSQNWTAYVQQPAKVIDIKKTLPKQEFDTLWGFGILSPDIDSIISTGALVVKGWVLGKKSQVKALKVNYLTEEIIETSVRIRRPKIAEQYPDIPAAGKCGFEFSLSIAGIPEIVELNLVAILEDLSTVPLCAIIIQSEQKSIESKST